MPAATEILAINKMGIVIGYDSIFKKQVHCSDDWMTYARKKHGTKDLVNIWGEEKRVLHENIILPFSSCLIAPTTGQQTIVIYIFSAE